MFSSDPTSPSYLRVKSIFALSLGLLLSTVALTSCGYQAGVSRPTKLASVKKLAVPTFTNDTLEPRLEVLVTNAVIKKLQMNGVYEIVPVAEADAVLYGRIKDITRGQFRSVRSDTLSTRELLMGINVAYKVTDRNNVDLVMSQARGRSNIVLDPNLQLTERQALADAAERLAISLAGNLSEGW